MITIQTLLTKLSTEGGCLVASADCHPIEIAEARSRDDFYVDHQGFGYVRRLPKWLARHSQHARGGENSCEATRAGD